MMCKRGDAAPVKSPDALGSAVLTPGTFFGELDLMLGGVARVVDGAGALAAGVVSAVAAVRGTVVRLTSSSVAGGVAQ